jgi:hypothetical protein
MSKSIVEKSSYTVEPLYQWDRGQVLTICGLSLAAVPEVHFAHGRLEDAVVQPTTMDAAGVIRAGIPDEMLEEAQPINAYICIDDGVTFKSLYKIVIPVQARPKPGTHEEETDG